MQQHTNESVFLVSDPAFLSVATLFLLACCVLVCFYRYVIKRLNRICGLMHAEGKGLSERFTAIELAIDAEHSNMKDVAHALSQMGATDQKKIVNEVRGDIGEALRSFYDQFQRLRDEEQIKQWASKGMELLSDMKNKKTSIEGYTASAIKNLVKYTGCNQGRLFVLSKDREKLDLYSTYAYGKHKFQQEAVSVDVGNGLLGECLHERRIILLTEVPRNYIKISSGLGEALPRTVILIPMIYRDQTYGVIEMASFDNLRQHHVDFMKRFSEGIGAEISGLLDQQYSELLLKQAQQQTKMLKDQEEELKKSMEEMTATQEDLVRKESILQDKLVEIETERAKNRAILENCVDAVISFDEVGKIDFLNSAAIELFQSDSLQLQGASIFDLFNIRIDASSSRPKIVTESGHEITSKTELTTVDQKGNELSLLVTAAHVKVNNRCYFTLLAQRISVELF